MQLYQLTERAAGADIIFYARDAIRFYYGNKIGIMRATNALLVLADEPEKRTVVFAREYKFSVFPGGTIRPWAAAVYPRRSNELRADVALQKVHCKNVLADPAFPNFIDAECFDGLSVFSAC